MMRILALVLFTCTCLHVQAQVNIITTICGDGAASYGGDDDSASKAQVNYPEGLCLDHLDNIYVADCFNNRVRKINIITGIITTIAGTGTPGFSGDNGPATAAELNLPCGVFADTLNNIYVADANNNRIRKINALTGFITTVAGSGPDGFGLGGDEGDGNAATNARLNVPIGICIDALENIFIADYGNNKVRKVNAVNKVITTYAGKGMPGYAGGNVGYSGDGGPAINAVFSGIGQVFANENGDVFISDQWNNVVRKVNPSGIISTVTGKGTAGYSGDNGVATNAQLNQPTGLYVDKQDNIFIADYWNGSVRKVDGATGIITTVAGMGVRGYAGDDGPATNAQLKCAGVFLDHHGEVYIADMDNNRIRKVYDTMQHYTAVKYLSGNNEVKVYPNPATNELIIDGALNSEMTISNLIGQQALYMDKLKSSQTVDLTRLLPGIYLVTISDPFTGTKVVRRIVKE